ncbi:MAG: response regulator [Polyangiaceae bacterium]
MTQPRILVIDDDEVARELMCELLRARGCEVFDSGSPIGVSKLIAQYQINVIVIDIMMPDISGDKLAKLLRNNPRLDALSIVLVSSGDAERLSQLAAEVGADAVVPKAELRNQLTYLVLAAHHRRQLSKTLAR